MGKKSALETNEGGHCMFSTEKGKKICLKKAICRAKRKLKKFLPDNVYFLSEECEKGRWQEKGFEERQSCVTLCHLVGIFSKLVLA